MSSPKTSKSDIIKYLQDQRAFEQESRRIRSLILESHDHDRHTCNCEGCKWWWKSTTTFRNEKFMELVPNIKNSIHTQGIYYYLRDFLLYLRKANLCKGQPIWQAYPTNKGIFYREI